MKNETREKEELSSCEINLEEGVEEMSKQVRIAQYLSFQFH
jgi:hypothetical protein